MRANQCDSRVWTEKLKSSLERTEDFKESLDALFEVTSSIGFTQVLYARQVVKSRIDENRWAPLRLNVRNFPKGWETRWRDFEAHDPYYHACFGGTLPFDWDEVQSSERLNSTEQ